MRLPELESASVRAELRTAPRPVLDRAAQGIEDAKQALAVAERALGAERAKKAVGLRILVDRRRELNIVSIACSNSRKLALEGDLPTMWRESRKNRERRDELQLLITYQEKWVAPAVNVAEKQAEIELSACRADLWEAEAVLQRCHIFVAAEGARNVDGGVQIDLSKSQSAALLKRTERERREIIPGQQVALQDLVEKMNAARAGLDSNLFS